MEVSSEVSTLGSIARRNDGFSQLIQEINHKLGSGLPCEQILDFAFDFLKIMIPYDRMGIALLEDGDRRIRLTWMRSLLPSCNLTKGHVALIQGTSLEPIVTTGEPRIINDLEEYLRDHPDSTSTKLILKDGIRSSLTCPLWARRKIIGVVFFSSKDVDTYRDEHVETYVAIAGEIAMLIEQSRLMVHFDESRSQDANFSKIIHDLKSPLTVIRGYLDIIKEADWFQKLPVKDQQMYMTLDRNTLGMMGLVEELGELRGGKGGRQGLILQEVNLRAFVLEVAENAKILAATKDIALSVSLEPLAPPIARFDKVKIRRVLDNLISNAVKFSKRQSCIQLIVSGKDTGLLLEVVDQGQGIHAEDLPILFTEFGRTRTLPTEREFSTGLGLAIAKAIVEQHCGKIWAESEYGNGSKFSFWIPAEDRHCLH